MALFGNNLGKNLSRALVDAAFETHRKAAEVKDCHMGVTHVSNVPVSCFSQALQPLLSFVCTPPSSGKERDAPGEPDRQLRRTTEEGLATAGLGLWRPASVMVGVVPTPRQAAQRCLLRL